MKNTTKIVLLSGFLWVTCTKFQYLSWQFITSTFILGVIFSMYRFFILQDAVYGDESTEALIEYIKQRKEDQDE